MSEEMKVGEPRPVYRTQGDGEESVLERVQVQFPPYFERFLEERDQRIAAELRRLEAAVERNGQDIARVMREMDLRFTQMERRWAEVAKGQEALRAEMDRRFTEVDRRLAEVAKGQETLRAEMDRRFTEAWSEMDHRFAEVRSEMDRRFTEVRSEMELCFTEVDRRLTELTEAQKGLRAEVRNHFYWTMGLLFPLVISVIIMMVRLLVGGSP